MGPTVCDLVLAGLCVIQIFTRLLNMISCLREIQVVGFTVRKIDMLFALF